jgi:hypothetical protein
MYGDLTGDGVPEAVLQIRCVGYRSDALMDQSGSQLLVVTMRSDHSLVGLGYVGVRHAEYPWYTVDDQKLFVQLKYDHSTPSSRAQLRRHGLRAGLLLGRYGFPAHRGAPNLNFRGQKDANGSRGRLASILRGDEVRCPAATVSFTFGEATENGVVYAQGRTIIEPVDLDGDHNDELIAGIGCRSLGYDAVSIYVFGQGETSLFARGRWPTTAPLTSWRSGSTRAR